jgi:hypothetical protein
MNKSHWQQGRQMTGYKQYQRREKKRNPLKIDVVISDVDNSGNKINHDIALELSRIEDVDNIIRLIDKCNAPIVSFNRGNRGMKPTCVRVHNKSCGCYIKGATLWSCKMDNVYLKLKDIIHTHYNHTLHLVTTRYSREDGSSRYFWLVHPSRIHEFEYSFEELCACPRWHGNIDNCPNRGMAMFISKETANTIHKLLPPCSNTFFIPSNYTKEEVLMTVAKHDSTEVHPYNIGHFLQPLFKAGTIEDMYPETKGMVLIACIERLTPLAKKLGYKNVTINIPGGKANIIKGKLENEFSTIRRETFEETECMDIHEKLIKESMVKKLVVTPHTIYICILDDDRHLFRIESNKTRCSLF